MEMSGEDAVGKVLDTSPNPERWKTRSSGLLIQSARSFAFKSALQNSLLMNESSSFPMSWLTRNDDG